MASTGATLAIFTPKDAILDTPETAAAVATKKGSDAVLKFGKELPGPISGGKPGPMAYFPGVLPRGPAGYSGTTGIKALITWSSPNGDIVGDVEFGASFQLDGATDTPDPTLDSFPVIETTDEVLGHSALNATVAGGLTQTLIPVTIADIKGGHTTAPTAGDHYRLRIRRATEDTVNDTYGGVVYVHSVELYDY